MPKYWWNVKQEKESFFFKKTYWLGKHISVKYEKRWVKKVMRWNGEKKINENKK